MSKLSIKLKKESGSSGEGWKPHKYQEKAIKHLLSHPEAGLFLDPGLGKTSITLAAIKILQSQHLVRRVLVIAPLRVAYGVWPVEVQKWKDFRHLRVSVLHGAGKEQALQQDADIYVINPEGLGWLLSGGRFSKLGADTLVVDESSKFKHTNTARFKSIKPVLAKFRRRWILTGTPAPNGLLDLFGQCYVMDLGKALGQYISHYRAKYFIPLDRLGYSWAPAEGSEQEIYKRIAPTVLRLGAKDHLDLPELVENIVRVDLPDSARKVYQSLEDELFAELDNGSLAVALSTAAASVKCRQIANGGLYRQFDADDRPLLKKDEWVHLHDAKTDAVMSIVEELGGSPVLVAYEFAHDRERLLKAFGKDTPFIGGGVAAKRTAEIVEAWNKRQIPVLLGHPAAMGHGLNMQDAGNHVIWHSLNWDLELDEQFVRRVWRQGNKSSHVFVHRIVARDTVDEAILRGLRRKGTVQTRLLDALRDYRGAKR